MAVRDGGSTYDNFMNHNCAFHIIKMLVNVGDDTLCILRSLKVTFKHLALMTIT